MFCKKKIKYQMTDEERDSFLRWQDYRINQLSFSINLFLGFAVASIGFLIGKKGQLYEGIGQKNPEMLLILFCWSVSAMFGVIAALSRLVKGSGVKSLFLTLALKFDRHPVNGTATSNSI